MNEWVLAGKPLRNHSDDRKVRPIDLDCFADHVGAAAVISLPQAVADHRHRIAAGRFIFLRKKRTTYHWLESHCMEEIAADEKAERNPRLCTIVRRHGRSQLLYRSQAVEDGHAFAEIVEIRIRDTADSSRLRDGCDPYNFFGLGNTEGAKKK